jgi:hypothetical protein
MTRPVSVTATCWVIIALAVEGLITQTSGIAEAPLKEVLRATSNHAPYSWIVLFSIFALLATVALSLCMLRGLNWARFVYLFVLCFGFVATLGSFKQVSFAFFLAPALKIVVFGTMLLRSDANRFFVVGSQKSAP